MSIPVSAVTPGRARRVFLATLLAVAVSFGSTAVLTPPANAIVGGQLASQEYPHMAAFLYDGNQICGASLIAPQWVLSAAHCVDSLDPSHYSFRIGGAPDLAEPGGETIQAVDVIVHPNYTDTYDVSLFLLERPSTFEPISLANPDTQRALWEPGDIARVIGYGGQFFQTPSIDEQLREVDVPVVDDAECDQSYFLAGGIDPTVEVCAGELHGTEDSCQGDSGGPLMVPDEQGAFVQMGVVSWGFGCGFPTQYGVYSRVGDRPLYDWIQETLANTEPPPPPPPPTTEFETVAVEPQGHVMGAAPFGGVTETEFGLTCSAEPVTQGVDAFVWELPAELTVPGAIAQVTGDSSLFYDLDLSFYDADCGFIDSAGTVDANERAEIPDGTRYIVAFNFFGADTLVDLAVDVPVTDTVTATTLELDDSSSTEGRYAEEVTFSARLTDATGAPLADQPVRFALVNGAGEQVQFEAGSATDANGISTLTTRLAVPEGDYTLEAVFIGQPERYTEARASSPFAGLPGESALSVASDGVGSNKEVTATLTGVASGAGLPGRTVELFANCESIGTGQTADDGSVTLPVAGRHRAPTTEFSAVFEGDSGAERYYGGSTAGPEC